MQRFHGCERIITEPELLFLSTYSIIPSIEWKSSIFIINISHSLSAILVEAHSSALWEHTETVASNYMFFDLQMKLFWAMLTSEMFAGL